MLSCFHLIPERHGQTDGQTDIILISISHVSMLTRDKKISDLVLRQTYDLIGKLPHQTEVYIRTRIRPDSKTCHDQHIIIARQHTDARY